MGIDISRKPTEEYVYYQRIIDLSRLLIFGIVCKAIVVIRVSCVCPQFPLRALVAAFVHPATATTTALHLPTTRESRLPSSDARQHNKYLSLSFPLLFCFLLFLLHPHPSIHQQHISHLYQIPPRFHIRTTQPPLRTAIMHHTLGLAALAAMAQAACPYKPLW